MNLFHDFLCFFFAPLFGLALDGGAGGGDGSAAAAAPAASAAAPADGGTPAPAGGAASPPAGGAAAPVSLIGADGKFAPGWAKTLGGTDALEAKFTDPKALVGSYLSLEKMISAKGIIPPGPNATPAEKAAFHKALGVPDKPEEYGIKMPEKIGEKPFPKELWNDAEAQTFAKVGHELGLTKAQVEALIQFDAARGLNAFESNAAASAKAQTEAITALKSEWGANYDANLKLAQKAAKELGGDDLLGHPLANDPAFIKAMAKVGQMTQENPAAGARGTSHAPANPQAAIAAIKADKKHPWQADFAKHGHSAKDHADAVAHMATLYKQAYPG